MTARPDALTRPSWHRTAAEVERNGPPDSMWCGLKRAWVPLDAEARAAKAVMRAVMAEGRG